MPAARNHQRRVLLERDARQSKTQPPGTARRHPPRRSRRVRIEAWR